MIESLYNDRSLFPDGASIQQGEVRHKSRKINPSFLLKDVGPYEMRILFQKALQSRFHLSLGFMDGHMLRQSMPSFS